MAASTIAASMFAVTASAYNFGIFFQTNGTALTGKLKAVNGKKYFARQ